MVAILGYSKEQITAAVQAMYGQVAAAPTRWFHFPVGRPAALAVGYPADALDRLPGAVVDRFAGVGYPFRAEILRPGDRVLDVGAGAGVDTLIAARLAGPEGRVWALDITPEMLGRLRAAAEAAAVNNVAALCGDAERIPLPDASVDVITSNGALNLVPDKRRALAELFRVLKPEGRMQIADVVIARPVPLGGRSDPQLWAECVVGASIDEDYLDAFRDAGFVDVTVLREFDYFAASPSEDTRRIAASLGARSVEIALRRPAVAAAPSPAARLARRLHPRRLARVGGRGLWGAVAAAAALVACYGTLAVVGLLSLLGVGFTLDEGLWAGVVAGAAVLAAAATALNLPRHRQPWPLLVAGLAAAAIAVTMAVAYDPLVEALGFAALFVAVGLDLWLVYRAECVPKAARGGGSAEKASVHGPAD